MIDNLLSNANEESWQQLEQVYDCMQCNNPDQYICTLPAMQMSPSTSQAFISNIEQFGNLLGETLDSETMKSTEARENIGTAKNTRFK